jgi:PIN domain nuclease of toxin-antitoxin system
VTYLLDTHIWLWLIGEPSRLRPELLAELRAPRTRLLLSAASSWEIAIKWALGRLTLPEPPETFVPSRMRGTGVDGLAVEHAHALRVADLPSHHADPFDRLLIAQAQVEDCPIVTVDAAFDRYDVAVVRAA